MSKGKEHKKREFGAEASIGHLKSDFRLGRNYLKGIAGDSINLTMSAAAFNFKKLLRRRIYFFLLFFIAFKRKKNEYSLA